jgi:hypothetical protein
MILVKRSVRYSSSLIKESSARIVFENSSITKKLWVKQIKLHAILLTLNIFALLISISLFDIRHLNEAQKTFGLNEVLGFISSSDILFVISTVIAVATVSLSIYHRTINLRLDFYKGKTTAGTWKALFTGSIWFYVNLVLFAIHPNIFFDKLNIINENNIITIFNSNANDYVEYSLNDIVCLLSLLKIISIFNILVNCISFNSDVADRVWFGNKQN